MLHTLESPEPAQVTRSEDPLRVFWAVTAGHLAIDVFNSMGPVLLTYLRRPLSLSAADIGLAVGLYQFLAGATQPAFGWLVDRLGSRRIGPGSVLITISSVATAFGVGLFTGEFWLFVPLFALAAIGSGAFHPQGTMHAADPAHARTATTTAVFFLGGQVGLASGPFLAGVLLDQVGPRGIYWLALAVLPVPLFMARSMRRVERPRHDRVQPAIDDKAAVKFWAVGLLALIFAARAWIFIGTASFLPLLFQSKGFRGTGQGLITGLFWLGGALTGVGAGWVADRLGRRVVVSVTTLLGSVLLYALPGGDGPAAFLLAIAAGALLGAPHSVLMVLAQAILPLRRGLASGVALGFLFAMGAVASWSVGLLADRFGLAEVLRAGALVGGLAGLMSLLLPASKPSNLAYAQ